MRSLSYQKVTLVLLILVLAAMALPANAIMLVSRQDAARIGKQVEADIIRQYGGLSNDPQVVNRVQRVGQQVAARSPRQDVQYTFKVLNSNVINAFAAPGGPVLITKALAQSLTDQELAFVLAHEVGHITAQHGREAINQALLAQGVFSLLLDVYKRQARTQSSTSMRHDTASSFGCPKGERSNRLNCALRTSM